MMMVVKLLLWLLLGLLAAHQEVLGQCQNVTTQEGFDIETYISARWYSQQQRPSPFQPATLNYCTTADYTEIRTGGTTVPAADYNEAYTIRVFNTAQDANGTVYTSDDEAQVGPDPGPLCGLQEFPETDPAKLAVGNCFDDPSRPFGSGPYWVVAYNETGGFALIAGGQPDVPTEDGTLHVLVAIFRSLDLHERLRAQRGNY